MIKEKIKDWEKVSYKQYRKATRCSEEVMSLWDKLDEKTIFPEFQACANN